MFSKLLCRHEYRVLSHTHGDEIIYCNYNRTYIKCSKCDKVKLIKPYIKQIGAIVDDKERADY